MPNEHRPAGKRRWVSRWPASQELGNDNRQVEVRSGGGSDSAFRVFLFGCQGSTKSQVTPCELPTAQGQMFLHRIR